MLGPQKRDVAVELWSNALDSGTQFSTYVGDDDSTTDILNKVPHHSSLQSERSLQKFKLFNTD